MSLLNLADLNSTELQLFLDSFDKVLCDCDGVLWHFGLPIPDVQKSITKLKEFGKEVRFVTNNSFLRPTDFCKLFKKCSLDVEPCEIANPCLAMIDYLKKIKFTQAICILGSAGFKEEIKNAGFKVLDLEVPDSAHENILSNSNLINEISQGTKNIGAITIDVDFSLNYFKLIRVMMCLHNPEVLFLVGCADRTLPLGQHMVLPGPEYFIKPVQDITGREPILFGKPGSQFREYVTDRFKISNPSRTLFIGDSLVTDIEFASKCGYQSLLVLTGNTKLDDVKRSTDAAHIPNFYLNSLSDLNELINVKLMINKNT